ncbi:NAD(P)/FAD-dependent oxidoreductase [bacterium]|nr:NAD(P)/FAD-dependent oxidoreductase [bacterium]
MKNVVVIGAGPAGIATAIQLRRHGIEPVLFEQNSVGGLLRNANLVENYPGFPEGIAGPALVALFQQQLENAGVVVHNEKVLELEFREEAFFIKTEHRTAQFPIAVIASGTIPKKTSHIIPENIKDRILYEVYPILSAQNKTVAIIGTGDAAFDYALSLSAENEVIILNRGADTTCLPLLRSRCEAVKSISYVENVDVQEIKENGANILLECTKNKSEHTHIIADYVIFAIGRSPCLNFLGPKLRQNSERLQQEKKLYFMGDVKNERFRQTAISVGDGVKAAMEIATMMERDAL